MLPASLPLDFARQINFDEGFLGMATDWQPNPTDPEPNRPGKRLSTAFYLPVKPRAACLCGSGRAFGKCCRLERYWYPMAMNPDGQSYSRYAPQSATFEIADSATLARQLAADLRLLGQDENPDDGFWIFFGENPVRGPRGTLCLGDLSLKQGKLVASALTKIRLEALLDVIRDVTDNKLGEPEIKYEPLQFIDKRTRQTLTRRV